MQRQFGKRRARCQGKFLPPPPCPPNRIGSTPIGVAYTNWCSLHQPVSTPIGVAYTNQRNPPPPPPRAGPIRPRSLDSKKSATKSGAPYKASGMAPSAKTCHTQARPARPPSRMAARPCHPPRHPPPSPSPPPRPKPSAGANRHRRPNSIRGPKGRDM